MDIQEWYKEYERDWKANLRAQVKLEVEQDLKAELAQDVEKERLEGQLAPLAHLFERRLGRALTSTERATLVERLRVQGAEHVGDVVLDLSPADLATWLAPSSER